MSDEIVLTLRSSPPTAVDASALAVHRWSDLANGDITRLPLRTSAGGVLAVGDLFDVRGERSARVRVQGDLSAFEGVGAGLESGQLSIEGDVGARAGAGMRGGELSITGNAGWGAGLEMTGGVVDIRGNAGPRAGGAALGAKRGMTGGELIVRGAAGPEAAACMRRGLVVIGRDAGEGAGRATIAGTVVVFGATGPSPGQWSKRGSVIALGAVTPPSTYRYACTYRPEYVAMLLRYLRDRRQLPVTREHLMGPYRRYSGDLAELGAGEILEWTRN